MVFCLPLQWGPEHELDHVELFAGKCAVTKGEIQAEMTLHHSGGKCFLKSSNNIWYLKYLFIFQIVCCFRGKPMRYWSLYTRAPLLPGGRTIQRDGNGPGDRCKHGPSFGLRVRFSVISYNKTESWVRVPCGTGVQHMGVHEPLQNQALYSHPPRIYEIQYFQTYSLYWYIYIFIYTY